MKNIRDTIHNTIKVINPRTTFLEGRTRIDALLLIRSGSTMGEIKKNVQ